ncbi:MAG: tetratricopeptide repeat protein [Bacteroidales bacterium]|nr:tetratricopeptide repeat protein [Bacteroidales bacterium]
MKYQYKILPLFVAVILLWACSTKKNTGFRRAYHNMNARYNAYFNGKESYKEGVHYMENNLQDDYSDILNVFLYDDASAGSTGSQMQRAEQKAAKVIKKHSITAKPKRKKGTKTDKEKAFYELKEYNKWVDNSYLLMGKAYFVEKNYKEAEINFTWILSEYPTMESRFDAMIWLARTYIQKKQYDKALDYLQRVEAEKEFPEKRLNSQLFTTYADLYIKQKRYNEAIPWLEMAIQEKDKKLYKRRYKYIIAQIYQKEGQDQKAVEMYKEVIKMHPPYQMEFSAKINSAGLFDKNSGDSKTIRKYLDKMIRDEKNKDFLDQIYYAIAQIDMKENLVDDGIEHYQLSAQKSVSNNNQKGKSYLALGDIYFQKLKYVEANAYYDSSSMFLSKSNDRYEEVVARAKNLGELVGYIKTIELQDSLLNLATMPDGQRNKIIAEIINKVIEDERKKAEEERQRQLDIAQYNENNRFGNNNSTSGGKWYFYNPAAIGMGQADFVRKWGQRRLEDNWRRKNKTINEFAISENGEIVEGTDTTQQKIDLKSRDYYLSQLPMTDSAQVASKNAIEEATYRLAKVYRERFVDYDKSIDTYLSLIDRFPETEYKLEAYYQLYQLYQLQKQTSLAEKYKDLILSQYPNSTPAKILTDPNYLAKQESEKNKTKDIYEKTYQAFQAKDYNKVIAFTQHIEKENPESPYIAKYKILKAQAIGATGNVDLMKSELNNVVKNYPESDEQALAEFMIDRINSGGFKNFTVEGQTAYADNSNASNNVNNNNSNNGNQTQEVIAEIEEIAPENLYEYDPNAPHLYIMAATGKISDLNRLKYNIIKYNLDYFLMFDFKVSDRKLTNNTKLILVKPLNDSKEAYKYLKLIRKNKDVYSEFNSLEMQQMIISEHNLNILLKDKDLNRYLMFFEQNYTK